MIRLLGKLQRRYDLLGRNFSIYNVGKSRPEYDFNYIFDTTKTEEIKNNINIRKGIGDISAALKLKRELEEAKKSGSTDIDSIEDKLYEEVRKIPNKTHPAVMDYGNTPKIINSINKLPEFENWTPMDFATITRKLNMMRTDHLGNLTGHRSYYFMADLAELEEALIKYSIDYLTNKGFSLVSVPDILPSHIIESCGMGITSDRTQIYSLDSSHHGPELCLSGTAEMSLAGLLHHTEHELSNLPLKLAAVSRCYRAETSTVLEQRGIYRVHQFTKVEMFGVSSPEKSDDLLEEFRQNEEELFGNLGLHLRTLDMPPHELGAPAFRKYDIEAWMPGRKMFGEISSCSNCTDYQSRRLNIKILSQDGSESVHAHTLNGTACAIPRMLIAILETYQLSNGKIKIPKLLRKYMNNKDHFMKRKGLLPELKLVKIKF